MPKEERPAASFDATYSTYESMKQKPLPETLVDLTIEKFMRVEVGGWGTNMKVILEPGTKISQTTHANGRISISLTPPKGKEGSIMTIGQLTNAVAGTLAKAGIKKVAANSAKNFKENIKPK